MTGLVHTDECSAEYIGAAQLDQSVEDDETWERFAAASYAEHIYHL